MPVAGQIQNSDYEFLGIEIACDSMLSAGPEQRERFFSSSDFNSFFMLDYFSKDVQRQKELFQKCNAALALSLINKYLEVLQTKNIAIIEKCLQQIINLLLMNEAQGNDLSFMQSRGKILEPVLLFFLQAPGVWQGTKIEVAVHWLLKDTYSSNTIFGPEFLEESLHLMIIGAVDESIIEILAKKLAMNPDHNGLIPWKNRSIWDACLNSSKLGSKQLGGLAVYIRNCNMPPNDLFTLLLAVSEQDVAAKFAILLSDKRLYAALKCSENYNNIFLDLAAKVFLLKTLNAEPLKFYPILQRKHEYSITDAEIKSLCIYAIQNFKNPDFIIFVLREILPCFHSAVHSDLTNAITNSALRMVGSACANDLVAHLKQNSAGYLSMFGAKLGMGSYESMLLSKMRAAMQVDQKSKAILNKYCGELEEESSSEDLLQVNSPHKRNGSVGIMKQ